MIRVIDLFAGPGGLGEGFSAYRTRSGESPFRIVLSVEKDRDAHRTLSLRALVRHLPDAGAWEDYEAYQRGVIDRTELETRWPEAARRAREETLGRPMALGVDNARIHERCRELAKGARCSSPLVLIGGPPCQAYSLVGRVRNRSISGYRPERDERNFLYREYLKVLARIQPDVFVMENVRGMLSARVGGEWIFGRILEDLRRPGKAEGIRGAGHLTYDVYSLVQEGDDPSPEDFLIRAEEYGIPQARHRIILLGVRRVVLGNRRPGVLRRSNTVLTLSEAFAGLPRLRSRLSRGRDSPQAWSRAIRSGITSLVKNMRDRQLAAHMQDRLDQLGSNLQTRSECGSIPKGSELDDWLRGRFRTEKSPLTGHESRGHMAEDLHRYFYAASWAEIYRRSPRAGDFPPELAPSHRNWRSGHFADRFRVQLWNHPSTTITSHISKDGHYFIHPDPRQCRSLTPREAARLQTFPDDYFFEGSRTSRYAQIGNAVPPFLALQIAEIVHALVT